VDEDLAEASVVPLVGGEAEPFGGDGDGGGVPDATPGHMPTNAHHHDLPPNWYVKYLIMEP
jgi:hypothetical protein